MYENNYPNKRYKKTIDFIKKHLQKEDEILDLGIENPLAKLMVSKGFSVVNTQGEDLDVDFTIVENNKAKVVTAFEILEHLVAPYNVLSKIKAKKLVASIPLNLWFAKAYRSESDAWDRHFHEFEDWQFDWLLEKAGWTIKARKKWTNPIKKVGLRPILRLFTPRYYIVYAERV
ncbi:MAG: methyltransferase [Bacteroidota bacterium]|nr:methyltransferase [Bacteroidota bacterium]